MASASTRGWQKYTAELPRSCEYGLTHKANMFATRQQAIDALTREIAKR